MTSTQTTVAMLFLALLAVTGCNRSRERGGTESTTQSEMNAPSTPSSTPMGERTPSSESERHPSSEQSPSTQQSPSAGQSPSSSGSSSGSSQYGR